GIVGTIETLAFESIGHNGERPLFKSHDPAFAVLADNQIALGVARHSVTSAFAETRRIGHQPAGTQKHLGMIPALLPAIRCVPQYIRENHPLKNHFAGRILLDIPSRTFGPTESLSELLDFGIGREHRIQ